MALMKFKRSAVPAKVPSIGDLALGELAINTYDGKLYLKKDDGTQAVVEIGAGGGGGSGTVTSVAASGGTTGLTFTGSPITTSGTLTLGGTLAVANGGTGATTAATARANLSAAVLGANNDITSLTGVTGGISTPDYIDFDTAATVTPAAARMTWNDGDGTLDLGLKGGNVTLQVGQEEVQRSFNEDAVPIAEGNVVYVSGAQGNRIAVSIAQANAAGTSSGTIGMATEPLAVGAEGFITTQGLVRKLNTLLDSEGNALVEGDLLYLSSTILGGYTKIEPAEPNYAVFVGYVVRVHATVGSIFVRPNVYPSIGDINKISIVSTASGNTLIYDAVAGYYKTGTLTAGTNVSIVNGAGSITINATDQYVGTVTSVSGTGTVNGISLTGTVTTSGSLTLGGTLSGVSLTTQVSGTLPIANGGTGATTLTSGYLVKGNGTAAVSASVVYDDGTNVGIGTSSPAVKLDVNGSIRSGTGTSQAILEPKSILFYNTGISEGTIRSADDTSTFTSIGVTKDVVRLLTANAERMRIDTSGNVGIGTSSPTDKLSVSGNIDIGVTNKIYNGASQDSAGIAFPSGTTRIDGLSGITFHSSATNVGSQTERMRIDSGGNVGIGTASPGYKLSVSGTAEITAAKEGVFAVVDGVGAVLDPNNGSIQTWTLGASRTPTQANWAAGQSITLMVDDGTAFAITWTTLGVVWETNAGAAPTLATTGYTAIVLWKVGTTIYGARVGDA